MWFGLLGCSNLSQYCSPPPTNYLYVLLFFWLVASSLDEHLGRGIRHDDVYEELAPTTYCKTSQKKKTHSHSPPLSKKTGFGSCRYICRYIYIYVCVCVCVCVYLYFKLTHIYIYIYIISNYLLKKYSGKVLHVSADSTCKNLKLWL